METNQNSDASRPENGQLNGSGQTSGIQRFALADNMHNIPNIKRMWRAQWPEFSWCSEPGGGGTRYFQMFAPDISRVGYGDPDENGNRPVWAFMCPQQGIWVPLIDCILNIEITVTQAGGTVNEQNKSIDAQMMIQPKIWFSTDNMFIQGLADLLTYFGFIFPSSKADAIRLNTYGVGQNDQPTSPPTNVLTVSTGMDQNYKNDVPPIAMHDKPTEYWPAAWQVANVAVQIGEIVPTGDTFVDFINLLVLDIFNLASHNLLQNQTVLSWNVWVTEPEEVYTQEWQMHADYWRFSIDVNHRSPEGQGRKIIDSSGNPIPLQTALIREKILALETLLESKFPLPSEMKAQFAAIAAQDLEGQSFFV